MKLDIDFSQHPAFAGKLNTNTASQGAYLSLIKQVDDLTDQIYSNAGKWKTLAERWAEFDTLCQPLRKQFDRLIDADTAIDPGLAPHLKKGFRLGVKDRAEDAELLMSRMNPKFEVSAKTRALAEKLDGEGHMIFQIPERWLNPLKEFLREDVEELRAKFPSCQGKLLSKEPGELQQALLADYCRKEGVLDAVSAFYGVEFSKVGYSLHISHPGDSWYHVYDDLNLPVAKTAQMHYDLGYEVPKAMVYLNDVTEEEGPFSLIPGSHQWPDLGFWLSLRKQWTIALQQYAKDKGLPSFSANSSPFRHAAVRSAFASMPTEIRSTGHPGDHILDDSALSKELLAKEIKITGAAGTLAVFAGGHTIHRGGIARSGERWALQVCFWPKDRVKLPSKEELQKAGLAAAKPEKAEQKKSFWGSLFGSTPTSSAEEVKKKHTDTVTLTSTAPSKVEAKPPLKAESTEAYSNKRFSLLLKQILGEGNRLSVVDIGGAVNLQPHWHRFHQVADYVVYEPHPQSYKELMERQANGNYYKNFQYLNRALSDAGGERTLYVTNVPTGSSLLPPKKGSIGDYPGNSYFYPLREEKIMTTTLRDSLNEAQVQRVDGVKLDTQGTELDIMKGMDAGRLAQLLFVEMEVSVAKSYEGSETSLEDVIPWMRDLGLELFDLRTNRSMGNAARLPKGTVTDVLAAERNSPALAQRLVEVDAIFFRDPRHLIDRGVERAVLQRLIVAMCAYNLYSEAIFAVHYGAEKGVLSAEDQTAMLTTVRSLFQEASLEVTSLSTELKSRQHQNWAQYMWVPYPSA
jgi:FkbM family methyltransferase